MLSINNLQPLIQDWKANVVNSLGDGSDTERLAEYALHVSRILAYPDLDVKDILDKIDAMGQRANLSNEEIDAVKADANNRNN